MPNLIVEEGGPIESLQYTIKPEHKGVTVFRGPNGVGKSILQRAMQSAAAGEGKIPLRDGAKSGRFEFFGARMTIGARCRHTGEFEVHHIEGRFDISTLIDPKLKTPTAADAARIKALVSLTGVEADEQLFKTHEAFEDFDNVVKAASVKTDDLVEMARRIKADYDESARSAEDEAEREDGHANGLSTHDDLDMTKESDAEILQHAYDEARDISSRLQERKESCDERAETDRKTREMIKQLRESSAGKELEQLEEKKKQIGIKIDSIDTELAVVNAKYEVSYRELQSINHCRSEWRQLYPDALAEIENAAKKLDSVKEISGDLSEPMVRIKQMLEVLSADFRDGISGVDELLDEYQKNHDAVRSRKNDLTTMREDTFKQKIETDSLLESIEANRQKLVKLEESLESPSQVPPTDEEIDAAKRAVLEASEAMDQGSLIRQAKKDIEKAKQHRKKAAEARDRADRYRNAGRSTDDVLSQSISSGPLRIESDGKSARLMTDTERGPTPYHDLSDGQRSKIAIDIGAECVGKDGLLVVDQQIWEGLDGDNRLLIHEHAKALDLYVFTFEATKEPGAPHEITPVPFGEKGE